MPSRGFHVLRASSAPFSTETSTTTSPVPPCRAATAATCARMNCRGIGLIAGSPTGSGRPGLVTVPRSEEHTSELQSRQYLVCRLLLEKKKKKIYASISQLTSLNLLLSILFYIIITFTFSLTTYSPIFLHSHYIPFHLLFSLSTLSTQS